MSRFRSLVGGLLALSLLVSLPQSLRGAEGDGLPASLKLAPADAAMYASSLRLKEQWDLVANSKAWATLQAMPMVQMGQLMLAMELQKPDSEWSQIQEFFAAEENQPLVALLQEMVSEEVFVSADAQMIPLLDVINKINAANTFAPIDAVLEGNLENELKAEIEAELDESETDPAATAVFRTMYEHREQLVVPQLVIGFKLKNPEAAAPQLARVEGWLNQLLDESPELKGRLKRTKVEGREYLTLTIDQSVIPWEELPADEIPLDEEEAEQLLAHLKTLKVVIHLGVRDDYLLISMGPSAKALKQFGKGKVLADHPHLAPVAAHSAKRLTGIGYVSEAFNQAANNTSYQVEYLMDLARRQLPNAPLPEEQRKSMLADLEELIADANEYTPRSGALLQFGFLTERGSEGYTYDWSEHPAIDATQKLSLLNHFGEAPLIATVSRARYAPEDYQVFRKWVGKIYGHVEAAVLPELDEESRELFDNVKEDFLPLVRELDQTTGEQFLPSLADGQAGFVLDADLTSRQWLALVPPTAQPLPMWQPAFVLGVSDSDLLVKAMVNYRDILTKGFALATQYSEELRGVDFRLPAPKVKTVSDGKLYIYPFAEMLGVDPQLAFNAGLGKEVAVISLAPAHSAALLKERTLRVEGPLAGVDRPLAGAVYFDISGTLDALKPWIDVAVRATAAPAEEDDVLQRQDFVADEDDLAGGLGDPADDSPEVKQMLGQVHAVLRVLSVFRQYSSLTYEEDGALVTHAELHVVDLEE